MRAADKEGGAGAREELAAKLASPAYTPPAAAGPALVGKLGVAVMAGDEVLAAALTKALLRIPESAAAAVAEALPAAVRPLRGELTALAGQLAVLGATALRPVLLGLVADPDLKTQLNAINAVAKLGGAETEAALLALLTPPPRREVRLALVRALGRAGGPAAHAALAELQQAVRGDAPAEQALARAQLILGREAVRHETSEINGLATLDAPVRVWLHVRRGLETLLLAEAAEAGFAGAHVAMAGIVELRTAAPLAALRRLRLVERLGLPLSPRLGEPLAAATAALIAAAPLMAQLTLGRTRFRLAWPEAGDAQIWALAQRLAQRCPGLLNDPTASTWEVHVRAVKGATCLELEPKRLADPRFAYRQGYVYAASHPTLAAALARVAGARDGDVVWDPFVGSGTELAERARLGPAAALFGTDLDPAAIATATANLAAAGVTAPLTLTVCDSLRFTGPAPTLILTNPPMGRRVQRGTLLPLIDAFVAHAARLLAPGGRLVWLSPLPERTAAALSAAGLTLTLRQAVDMGGFDAELQRAEKAQSEA